jgi:hypothetical protein
MPNTGKIRVYKKNMIEWVHSYTSTYVRKQGYN